MTSSWTNAQIRLFSLGLFLVITTAVSNIGFIAIDEYSEGIATAVPAQHQPAWESVATGIHPTVPKLVLRTTAKAALNLGIENPSGQIRFIFLVLGLFTFCTTVLSLRGIFSMLGRNAEATLAVGLLGLYFLCPLIYTRPMAESMSIPMVALSVYWATRYWTKGERLALALSLAFLAIGSVVRYQIGICSIALLYLSARRKDLKAIGYFFAVGVSAFVLIGLLDKTLTGGFHRSLITYLEYNLHAAERHGAIAWYAFFALFLGLSIPPTFVSRFERLDIRKEYQPLLPAVAYFICFLIAHTISPHKEERFAIPILPVYLLLLVPLLNFYRERSARWRLGYFAVVNFFLLILVIISTPQKNVVDLAIAISRDPSVHGVASIGESIAFFPEAYAGRHLQVRKLDEASLGHGESFQCDEWVLLRKDYADRNRAVLQRGFKTVGAFSPALPEQLAIRLNPSRNMRRSAIEAFQPLHCR